MISHKFIVNIFNFINSKMKQKKLLFLLLALVMSATGTFAQTVGTRFAIGDVTYQITVKDLATPANNTVGIYSITGTGVKTIPATVQNAQDHEYYKVTSVIPWVNEAQVGAGVTEIVLPEGLTTLPDGSFYQTGKGLTKVTIPSTCTSIGGKCFSNNEKLKEFAVNGGSSFQAINGVLYTKDGKELVCFPTAKTGDYAVVNGTTTIRPFAFTQAVGIGTLTIPASVTTMTFSESQQSIMTTANNIKVDAGNPNFCDVDGVLCNKNATKLLSYPARRNSGLQSMNYTVPATVNEIAPAAFYVSSVRSVDLSNVETIGDAAFEFSYDITSVTIGPNVNSIGDAAFTGCVKLASISVNNANTKYSSSSDNTVLFNKDKTELLICVAKKTGDYTIPSTVTSIAGHAFYQTTSIGNITIPASVKSIGKDGFGYTGAPSITIASGSQLETIGSRAFEHASKLTTFNVPASVKSIDGNAFFKMDKITTITIADNSQLTTLGPSVFAENPELTTLKFNGSTQLTTIPLGMVSNDPKLTSFEIPASVTTISQNAFQNTPALQTVTFKAPSSITVIGKGAFAYAGIKSIELPNTVTDIEQQAFDNCMGLTTVSIPASVRNVGTGTFNMCENLTKINVDANNNNYASLDGMLCDKNKTKLVVFPAGKADSKYTLVPYFTSVEPYAFYGSKKVTNITFPRSVTSIGQRAIALCTNLKSMSFMGEDQVPALTADILYQSSAVNKVNVYVRKRWFENPANTTTINNYKATFKDVHPSFVPAAGYDRGTEFFPTSDDNVGTISFFNERTSVIISPTATEEAYTDFHGTARPTKTYTVSSVLDFAYENTAKVETVVLLADVSYVGMNAFKGNSIKGVYFVGKVPADLGSINYEQSGSYEFKENQAIYVRPSAVNDYKTKWNIGSHTLGITSEIPQKTNKNGGTVCFPFDVKFPSGKVNDDIKPYIPKDYEHAHDSKDPFIRAYSLDDYYVPAFVGVFIRSKNKESVESYCQMDDDQKHVITNLQTVGGYNPANYRMKGMVQDTIIHNGNEALYAFKKSTGKLVKLNDGATFPYFKAYLRMPAAGSNGAKPFSIVFDDDSVVTGIEEIDAISENNADDAYYNINGTRVATPKQKGIYIRNGKKVIIK